MRMYSAFRIKFTYYYRWLSDVLSISGVGRGSSVGIATRYGLVGPGIETRCRRYFPYLSTPALGPTQPPIEWVPGLSRG
jgi:hypothetical protein